MWVGENRINDIAEACKSLGILKPLLVTDKGLAETDIVKNTLLILEKNKLQVKLYSNVVGNPTGTNVNEGVESFKNNKLPNYCLEAIASWYIFMKKIFNKELVFDYYEPQWNMLKDLLPDNKIDEFIFNKQLWGKMIKNKKFTDSLKNKILEFLGKY